MFYTFLKCFLCRLREFDSGVMVLQSSNHSEDKVIKNTAALVNLSFVNPLLALSAWQTKTDSFAKSVDPDETAHNEPSHQDLCCLPFCF